MCPITTNSLSLDREEFDDTLATVEQLLEECNDSDELIVENPSKNKEPRHVNLYNHLLRLRDRLRSARYDLSPNARQVTIAFN